MNNLLHKIVTMGELAKDMNYKLGDKSELYWSMINRASKGLENIVKNVRLLHIKKGTLELQPTELVKIFDDLQFVFQDWLNKKNIDFKVNFPKDEVPMVIAEPISLTHNVLSNLVSNSIKFTEEGGKISIDVVQEGDGVVIRVSDNGHGIVKEKLKHLFEFNKNESKLGTHGELGTGQGLQLVNTYIKLYGGKIVGTSKHISDHPGDSGTVFHIFLRKASSS